MSTFTHRVFSGSLKLLRHVDRSR